MEENLNEWFGAHLWIWWLLAVVLCLTVEMLERRWYAAAFASGAAVAAGVAWFVPESVGIQGSAGAVAAVAGLLLVGWLRRAPEPRRGRTD